MINLDQKNIFNSLYHSSSYAFRIISELYYAERVAAVTGGKYDSLVTEARDILLKAINDDGVITKNAAMQAENVLLPMKDAAKKYRVHCIAHAHIDMNWMWGYQETVSVTIDTFRTVLDLMKEYPDLTFAQSQASTYEIIERFAPSMLTEIKERIKEGRWEVSASTWTETDKNMPCGESLARHILYTKRYLSKLLDIDPESLDIDFEPDTFGHNAQVPEALANGGIGYDVTQSELTNGKANNTYLDLGTAVVDPYQNFSVEYVTKLKRTSDGVDNNHNTGHSTEKFGIWGSWSFRAASWRLLYHDYGKENHWGHGVGWYGDANFTSASSIVTVANRMSEDNGGDSERGE